MHSIHLTVWKTEDDLVFNLFGEFLSKYLRPFAGCFVGAHENKSSSIHPSAAVGTYLLGEHKAPPGVLIVQPRHRRHWSVHKAPAQEINSQHIFNGGGGGGDISI